MFKKQIKETYLSGIKSVIDFIKRNKEQPIEELIKALEDIYNKMKE